MIEYINQIASSWAEFFGLMILQNTVFLVVIFIALAALKNSSAQVKYIVGMAGIVKLLLPPFLPYYIGEASSSSPLIFSGPANAGSTVAASTTPNVIAPVINTFGILFIAWIILAALYLVLAFGSTFVLRLKLAAAKPVKENVQRQSDLRLYQTQHISTPLSIGIFPRDVFLPTFFKSLPQQCQQVLINHELAHIKRKDGFFQLLQMLAQAVYFFHPLVWLLNERVNEYREMACDDTAIKQANLSPMEYSRYLVHMAESVVHPHWSYSSATALIRQKGKLSNRVNYLLKESKVMKKKMMVVVVVLLGLMVFPLSWYCTKKTETNVVTNPVADTASDRAQIFVAYDVPPAPVGGFDAIQQNLHYPEEALRAGLAGRVYLNIFIDIEGKIKEAKALKALGTETDLEAHPDLRKNIALPGIDPSVANLCTEAAIAAAKSVNWTPAKQRDKTVEVWVGIPVVFKLDDGATAETLSNYEGTPGPVGGYSDVIEKLGMDIPVDEKEKAMYMRLNMAGLLYCQIDERGKLIKSETQRPVDAECKANFIKAAEEVSWNIVRKNGQAIKYWHKIGLICNDKNTEKEISSTEIESSKLSREAIRAEYKRLGITRTTFSKNNEVETFKNSKAVYFCTVNKDGYVIKANKVKSSGNNNLDNDLLNYIKSHDIVGISGDIKEPVKMYIGLTLSET